MDPLKKAPVSLDEIEFDGGSKKTLANKLDSRSSICPKQRSSIDIKNMQNRDAKLLEEEKKSEKLSKNDFDNCKQDQNQKCEKSSRKINEDKENSQSDTEIKEGICKLSGTLKPNSNIDRLVKDIEIIRKNLTQIMVLRNFLLGFKISRKKLKTLGSMVPIQQLCFSIKKNSLIP